MTQLIIAGSTGLIGKTLTTQLTNVDVPVTLLSRRQFAPQQLHHKVLVTDFNTITLPAASSANDSVLCALGTTIKKAGSKAAFTHVDFDLVIAVALAAKQSGYKKFMVISSLGARSDTLNFYLQTKAKMEQALEALNFDSLVILRPSLLLGEREEFRLGEKVGELVSFVLTPIWIGKLARYRPISADHVAAAMIKLVTTKTEKVTVIESELIRRLATEQ